MGLVEDQVVPRGKWGGSPLSKLARASAWSAQNWVLRCKASTRCHSLWQAAHTSAYYEMDLTW
jgi:hypothetical protein